MDFIRSRKGFAVWEAGFAVWEARFAVWEASIGGFRVNVPIENLGKAMPMDVHLSLFVLAL